MRYCIGESLLDPFYIFYGYTTWFEYQPYKGKDIIKKYPLCKGIIIHANQWECSNHLLICAKSIFTHLPCTKINRRNKIWSSQSVHHDICFPIKIDLHIYLDIFLCFYIHAQDLNNTVLNKWHKAALYIRCYNNCIVHSSHEAMDFISYKIIHIYIRLCKGHGHI